MADARNDTVEVVSGDDEKDDDDDDDDDEEVEQIKKCLKKTFVCRWLCDLKIVTTDARFYVLLYPLAKFLMNKSQKDKEVGRNPSCRSLSRLSVKDYV